MIDFPKALGIYKNAIDKQLEQYFDRAILDMRKKDALMSEALQHTKEIALAGGKRIRGALVCVAYEGFGGIEKKKILKIAAAIELYHLYLLIHDDIIDRGQLRHGKVTVQNYFAKKMNKLNVEEAAHFGNSMALIIGDMLAASATKIILESDIEKSFIVLIKIQDILTSTIIGQSQDISIEYKDSILLDEILAMYERKTAKYTFEGPLQIGAILAGVSDRRTMQMLSDFSVPLGIAYQIQDDMLDIFGKEKEMGKIATSDLEEGKKTLLVAKTLELATKDQKKRILKSLGKKNLTTKEIDDFRKILQETGALSYCQNMCNKYFETGSRKIEKIVMLENQKKFLLGMVQYLENRKA